MGETRAAVYCRISADPDGAGLGVKRQEADCRKLAAARGWVVAGVYVDNDVSAWNGKPRPEYQRLLADIKGGAVGAVVVYKLDRLHRQPRELEEFIPLCLSRGVAVAPVSGEVDLASAQGQLQARLMGAIDKHASDVAAERVRRKMVEVAEAGRPHGGPRPYGFAADRVAVDRHEAAVIREVTAALLSGASLRGVCLLLNARGELTPFGNKWEPSVMSRMLLRPRLIGKREHRQSGEHPAVWPPIITEVEQIALRALLQNPSRRRVGAPGRHLLSGLLRCGECGSRMVTWSGWQRNRRSYICPAKPRGTQCVAVVADPADTWVTEAVLTATDARQLDAPEEIIADTTAQDRRMLVELAQAWARHGVTMAEYQAARKVIEERIADTEARIAGQAERDVVTRTSRRLREHWPEMDMEDRRAAVALLIDHIDVARVKRGRVFNPDRLRPVWRV
jgi:site-specific DNA recombinase